MLITIDIADNIDSKFDIFASKFGGSKENYIKQALIEKLQELEDLYDAKNVYFDKNSSYKSLEELEKEFGLAD